MGNGGDDDADRATNTATTMMHARAAGQGHAAQPMQGCQRQRLRGKDAAGRPTTRLSMHPHCMTVPKKTQPPACYMWQAISFLPSLVTPGADTDACQAIRQLLIVCTKESLERIMDDSARPRHIAVHTHRLASSQPAVLWHGVNTVWGTGTGGIHPSRTGAPAMIDPCPYNQCNLPTNCHKHYYNEQNRAR